MSSVSTEKLIQQRAESLFMREVFRAATNLLDAKFDEIEASKSNFKKTENSLRKLKRIQSQQRTETHSSQEQENKRNPATKQHPSKNAVNTRRRECVVPNRSDSLERGNHERKGNTPDSESRNRHRESTKCQSKYRNSGLRNDRTGDTVSVTTPSTNDKDNSQTTKYICLQPLLRGEENNFKHILEKYGANDSVKTIGTITLRGYQFQCLKPRCWLDDEVVNAFVILLNQRNMRYRAKQDAHPGSGRPSKKIAQQTPKSGSRLFQTQRPLVHIFNSFFLHKRFLASYDYAKLRMWRNKACGGVPISGYDIFLFPYHDNMHWTLAVIDMRGRQFLYFDSLGGRERFGIFDTLRRWLRDEIKEWGSGMEMNIDDIDKWGRVTNPEFMPKQKDGASCGLFMLYMAYFLELGQVPIYAQSDMDVLRGRTAMFLKKGMLPDRG